MWLFNLYLIWKRRQINFKGKLYIKSLKTENLTCEQCIIKIISLNETSQGLNVVVILF